MCFAQKLKLALHTQTVHHKHANLTAREQTVHHKHVNLTAREQTVHHKHANLTAREQTEHHKHANLTAREHFHTPVDNIGKIRPLLLLSLFLVASTRSFFRKYKKKKSSKSTKLLPARARSHSPLLASCMTRRSKTAKPTRIKGEPLSGGGMNDENSEGTLKSSWGRSIKTEKNGLHDLLVCVGIFQAVDVRVNARNSTKAGPIDDHCDFVPFAASSAKYEGKYGGGARHKMELSTSVLLCFLCFGEIVTVEGLVEERDSERTREKTPSVECMSTSATQCAATLQGKCLLQKGTDVYQEQENFWRDWKLHNNIFDLLSSD